MSFKAGKGVVLNLTDSGDVVRDVSAFVTKVTLSLKGKGLVDVTTMGSSGHQWASDELEDCNFSVDFLFDPTATTGIFAVLKSLRTLTVAKAFEIGPHGSAPGDTRVTGTCFLEDLPLEVSVGDMVKLSGVPFKVDGAVIIDIY